MSKAPITSFTHNSSGQYGIEQKLPHIIAQFVACGVVYFLVLETFLAIPAFNGVTQIRPASGLSPVLGLLFGFPAALGCASGNLVSDLIHWPNDPWLLYYFAVQLIYALGLRTLWGVVFRDNTTPRLNSATRIAVFIIGSLLDSALVTGLLMPVELDSMQALNIHVIRLLNNFLAIVYVGSAVMLLVERLRTSKRDRTLSERFALIALSMTTLASILCVAATLASRDIEGAGGDVGFDGLVAQIYLTLTAVTVCLFSLACVMLAIIERSIAQPLCQLASDARTLAKRMEAEGPEKMRDGALDVHLPSGRALGEIELVARESNEMRHALGTSMIEAQASARERERVATELELASQIQANALPGSFSDLEETYGTTINAVMHPARSVGGDFYDVFPLDEHRICALVADVSDKGVPAALFMMRAMAEARECLRSAASLGEGLSHATSHLCANNDAMLFVTMFAMALDIRTGEVEYANAGHNLPMLCSPSRGNRKIRAKAGLPLGVLDDYFYLSERTTLLPGEQIVLYTDGVTEARSTAGELFGDARLEEALMSTVAEGVSALDRVESAVEAFSAGAEQADDITILSLGWMLSGARQRFAADVRLCADVCSFAHEHLSSPDAADITFELDLIIEELFVNIATHAYEGLDVKYPSMEIFVADDAFNHAIHLVLQDEGTAYDPTARKMKPLSGVEPIDELQPGGMGVLLVNRLADSIRYERLDDRNILHITKKYGL